MASPSVGLGNQDIGRYLQTAATRCEAPLQPPSFVTSLTVELQQPAVAEAARMALLAAGLSLRTEFPVIKAQVSEDEDGCQFLDISGIGTFLRASLRHQADGTRLHLETTDPSTSAARALASSLNRVFGTDFSLRLAFLSESYRNLKRPTTVHDLVITYARTARRPLFASLKSEVREVFGSPAVSRTENDNLIWTYNIGSGRSLVVVFGKDGLVEAVAEK